MNAGITDIMLERIVLKMLTKEEYVDIIEFLDFFYGDNLINTVELRKEKSKELQKEDLENFKHKLDELLQLINEHFDNPPLKWYELKEGMWVWDSLYKFNMRVVTICEKQHYFYSMNHDGVGRLFKFEENRFYRKQVDEKSNE